MIRYLYLAVAFATAGALVALLIGGVAIAGTTAALYALDVLRRAW